LFFNNHITCFNSILIIITIIILIIKEKKKRSLVKTKKVKEKRFSTFFVRKACTKVYLQANGGAREKEIKHSRITYFEYQLSPNVKLYYRESK